MQHERRHNPYPWTWEIPAGILLTLLVVLVLGAHAGRALANLAVGGGPTWPPAAELLLSLPALIQGDAAAGLADAPAQLPSPAALRGWIIATELAALMLSAWVGVAWYRRGPGRVRGMATKTEAEQVLGLTRLRQKRALIRPDLYGHPDRKSS